MNEFTLSKALLRSVEHRLTVPPPLDKAVNDSVYCVITTQPFFESKLFIIGKKVFIVFLNKTAFHLG